MFEVREFSKFIDHHRQVRPLWSGLADLSSEKTSSYAMREGRTFLLWNISTLISELWVKTHKLDETISFEQGWGTLCKTSDQGTTATTPGKLWQIFTRLPESWIYQGTSRGISNLQDYSCRIGRLGEWEQWRKTSTIENESTAKLAQYSGISL